MFQTSYLKRLNLAGRGSCFIVSFGEYLHVIHIFFAHQKDPRRSWKDLIAATANEVWCFLLAALNPVSMLQRTGDVKQCFKGQKSNEISNLILQTRKAQVLLPSQHNPIAKIAFSSTGAGPTRRGWGSIHASKCHDTGSSTWHGVVLSFMSRCYFFGLDSTRLENVKSIKLTFVV